MSQALLIDDEHVVHARFDWGLCRRMLRFARPYRLRFGLLGAAAVGVAVCDVALPLLVGGVIDEVSARGAEARLLPYGLGFAAVAVGFITLIFSFITLAGGLSVDVSYDIRAAAFAHLQKLHLGYFDQRPVGWLMSRLTSDCNLLSRIMGWSLLDLVWGTCMLTGVTVAMLVLNWQLALVVLTIVPPLALVSRWFQWRLLLWSRRVRRANSHLTAGFNESIQGLRTTKSLAREPESLGEFGGLSGAMFGDSMRSAAYTAAFWPVLMTICAAAVGLVLWRGGASVLAGTLTVGQLVMFIGLATRFADPIRELARTVTMVLGAQASAERVQQVLDTEPAIRDSEAVARRLAEAEEAGHGPAGAGAACDGGAAGIERVEFRGVGFAYKPGEPVLQGCDLAVERGQTVALVGPTGGGKSTIVSLLCRFYEPQQGEVLLDGVEYRQRSLAWYQSQLGVVPQSPQLFNESIRENIRYGRLDATDAEVEAAAKLVNAHGFITELPEGYDTKVGEGANALSTGQKQLVALARAVLSDPQIFVMDEATSSVDTATEGLIQAAVERALRGRIAFVIAHRLSTIKHADQILLVDGGRIVERGTHHELIAACGRYHALYTQQFTAEGEAHTLAASD